MISDSTRFDAAIAAFDSANAGDRNHVRYHGQDFPEQLFYGQRMTWWLERLESDPSEALRLAARSQHIRRWEIPRDSYPRDRQGYHRWRQRLYEFHAETAGEILRRVGYDEPIVARVQELLRKKGLKTDPEMQLLEDVICLVFLEHYLAGFAQQHDRPILLRILRKTWGKMSARGREAARHLELPDAARQLVADAVEDAEER